MANPAFSPTQPHFFQPLLPGFHRHLTVPVAFFFRHMRGRDEEDVVKLRSDGWEGTWEVTMDGRRFTDGWEEFAVAHGFQVGDFLIFRHEGNLVFQVTAFGPNCCQIQYAPFHPDDDDHGDHDDDDISFVDTGNLSRKKEVKINPQTEDYRLDHTFFIAAVTVAGMRDDVLYPPRSFARRNGLDSRDSEIVLMNGQGKSWTLSLRHKKPSGRAYIKRGWREFCRANGKEPGVFCRFKLVQNGAMPVLRLFPGESGNRNNSSGGSPDMKKKKTRMRRRVSSLTRQNRFVTLTLTSYSLSKSKLRIPRTFTKASGLDEPGQKITLLDRRGRGWPSYLRLEDRSGRVMLGKGWRSFCEANGLKKGESFTLEVIWTETAPILKLCPKVKIEQSA